jgi:hypothetical protein
MRITNASLVGDKPVAKVAAQVANSLILNKAERKVFTFNQAFTAASSAGSIVPITQALVQGDNLDNRTGDKVTLTDLHVSINMAANAVALATQQGTIRHILFYDTMANGAVPSVADVLQSASVTGRYTAVNLLKKRFRIIWDFTQPLVNTSATHVIHRELHERSKTPVFYQDGTNIAGANSKNAMFMLVITDQAVNPPGSQFSIQSQFIDM